MRTAIIILVLLTISCCKPTKDFRKYTIEKGIITYSIEHPFKEQPIKQRIYFTNYGATEYIEYVNKEAFPTFSILKKDSLEYVFVTDSMTITKERGFDFIYENLVKNDHSKLSNDELILNKKSDTLIDTKKCELFKFEMPYIGQKGKVALWKGIPIWISSGLDKGLFENVNLITLDLKSKIPVEKTKIMDYVDTE